MTLRQRLGALRQRRLFRWTVDLLLIAVVFMAVNAWQTRRHRRGESWPGLPVTALDSAPALPPVAQGKPSLVAFWAPWCGVCSAEAANLNRVQRWLGARANVFTVALAYDQVASVEAFRRKHALEVPVYLGNDALQEHFQIDAFPTVYFLDEEGKVKRSSVGYTTTAGLLWRLFL